MSSEITRISQLDGTISEDPILVTSNMLTKTSPPVFSREEKKEEDLSQNITGWSKIDIDIFWERIEASQGRRNNKILELEKVDDDCMNFTKQISDYEKDLSYLIKLALLYAELYDVYSLYDEKEKITKEEEQTIRQKLQDIYDFSVPQKDNILNITDPMEIDPMEMSLVDSFITTDIISKYQEILEISEWFLDSWKNEFLDLWKSVLDISQNKRKMFLFFLKEQLLNPPVNKKYYLYEVRESIIQYKRDIISIFDGNMDANTVDFELDTDTKYLCDTHNGGKYPLKISFYYQENKKQLLFEIYYKPRDASLDKAVIDVFKKLNASQHQSVIAASRCCCRSYSDIYLPTYEIHNFSNKSDSSKVFSIWECVYGVKSEDASAPEVTIENWPIPLEEPLSEKSFFRIECICNALDKISLRKKLLRLNAVCNKLGISDLHHENIIYRKMGQKNVEIVPIDLENRQPGKSTGLMNNISITQEKEDENNLLTTVEKDILEKQKAQIENLPYRYVPLKTSKFVQRKGAYASFIDIAGLVAENLKRIKPLQEKERDNPQDITIQKLKKCILTDILNDDIPYFIRKGDDIYHSSCEEENNRILNFMEVKNGC